MHAGPLPRAEARAVHGLSDRQIDRLLAAGRWVADRRGLIRPADDAAGVAPDVRAALLSAPSRRLVVSHFSAARLLGLPEPVGGWPVPELTAVSGPTRRRNGVHVRVSPVGPDEQILVEGLAVTSAARTVVDCARTGRGRDALAVADAALHRRLVGIDDLLTVLGRQSRWPGVASARRLLVLADAARESPLESWSAWAFAEVGLPAPRWQVAVREAGGAVVGRVDAWWDAGVAGEADGRAKYALAAAARSGEHAVHDVLQAERRREQRLRASGVDVVRWGAADVLSESRARDLAGRIRDALGLAVELGRFTGDAAPVMLQQATADPGPAPPWR